MQLAKILYVIAFVLAALVMSAHASPFPAAEEGLEQYERTSGEHDLVRLKRDRNGACQTFNKQNDLLCIFQCTRIAGKKNGVCRGYACICE